MNRLGNSQSSGEDSTNGLSEENALAIFEACIQGGICTKDGAVDIELSQQEISERLEKHLTEEHKDIFRNQKDSIVEAILHSRYANLYSLLRHHVTEETYLGIVRNQILVDVQVSYAGFVVLVLGRVLLKSYVLDRN